MSKGCHYSTGLIEIAHDVILPNCPTWIAVATNYVDEEGGDLFAKPVHREATVAAKSPFAVVAWSKHTYRRFYKSHGEPIGLGTFYGGVAEEYLARGFRDDGTTIELTPMIEDDVLGLIRVDVTYEGGRPAWVTFYNRGEFEQAGQAAIDACDARLDSVALTGDPGR